MWTSEWRGRVEGKKVYHTTRQSVSEDTVLSLMYRTGGNMERGVAFLLVSFQNSETIIYWSYFLILLYPTNLLWLYAKMNFLSTWKHFLVVLTLLSWTLNRIWQELPDMCTCIFVLYCTHLNQGITWSHSAALQVGHFCRWVHWFVDLQTYLHMSSLVLSYVTWPVAS